MNTLHVLLVSVGLVSVGVVATASCGKDKATDDAPNIEKTTDEKAAAPKKPTPAPATKAAESTANKNKYECTSFITAADIADACGKTVEMHKPSSIQIPDRPCEVNSRNSQEFGRLSFQIKKVFGAERDGFDATPKVINKTRGKAVRLRAGGLRGAFVVTLEVSSFTDDSMCDEAQLLTLAKTVIARVPSQGVPAAPAQ